MTDIGFYFETFRSLDHHRNCRRILRSCGGTAIWKRRENGYPSKYST